MTELPDNMLTPEERAQRKALYREHDRRARAQARHDALVFTKAQKRASAPRPEVEVGARVFPELKLIKLELTKKETRVWHDHRRARESLCGILRGALEPNACTRFEVWSAGGRLLYGEEQAAGEMAPFVARVTLLADGTSDVVPEVEVSNAGT